MKTYTLNPSVPNPARKRLLLSGIIALLFFLVGVGFLMPGRTLPPQGYVGVFVFVLVFAGFSFRRALKRMDETLPSYTLTVSEDSILKQQSHYPDIKIAREEVKTIWRTASGEIVVKTGDWKKFIVIPPSLVGLDEVERTLNQWKPIKAYPRTKTYLAFFASLVVSLLILFAFREFVEGGKPGMPVILAATLGFMVLNLFVLRMLRRMPNLDERSRPKQRHYILAIFFIIMFLFSIVVFFGMQK